MTIGPARSQQQRLCQSWTHRGGEVARANDCQVHTNICVSVKTVPILDAFRCAVAHGNGPPDPPHGLCGDWPSQPHAADWPISGDAAIVPDLTLLRGAHANAYRGRLANLLTAAEAVPILDASRW